MDKSDLFFKEKKDLFLNNELNSEDNSKFQQRIAIDDAFAKELSLEYDLVEAFKYKELKALKHQLDSIHRKGRTSPKIGKSRIIYLKWIGIAAGLALALFGFWNISVGGAQNNKSLAMNLFEPYDFMINQRGDELAENMIALSIAYKQEQYKKAIGLFEEELKTDNKNNHLWMGLGVSYFKTTNYSEANNAFQKVIDENDAFLKDQALWYQSLSFLCQNKEGKAKANLERLSSDSMNDYFGDAQKLLSKLN